MEKEKVNIEEDGAGTAGVGGFGAGTTIASVGGAYQAPLMAISKRKLNKRIVPGNKLVKDAPQGRVSEDEEVILKKDLKEWFKVQKTKAAPKPSYDGGKFVEINPKCENFPYCNQGATDGAIKLIGETKDEMCPNCYKKICEIAEMTHKTPEYITKIIIEGYLSKKQ